MTILIFGYYEIVYPKFISLYQAFDDAYNE